MNRRAVREDDATRIVPHGASPGPVTIEESMRAVLAGILSQYRAQLIVAEAGVVDDRDIERLHQFRVAIRRTRALLTHFGDSLDGSRVDRFQADFAWVAKAAGRQRDLDVLLDRSEHRRKPRLETEVATALHEEIAGRRKVAHRQLLGLLASARYRKLKVDWFHFLDEQRNSGARSTSARQVAAATLRKRWDELCRRSGQIGSGSRFKRLHALRKDGKELRYAIEAFTELFGDSAVAELTRPLRRLQDWLGDLCDLYVQVELLAEIVQECQSRDDDASTADALRLWHREMRDDLRSARKQAAKHCRRLGRKRNRRGFEKALKEAEA